MIVRGCCMRAGLWLATNPFGAPQSACHNHILAIHLFSGVAWPLVLKPQCCSRPIWDATQRFFPLIKQ